MEDIEEEYEALIQFLYLAPVGLVQTSMDGEITMINPLSAQLLMPLSRDGNLANFFMALESVLPELRHLCAAFASPHGKICDGMRMQVSAGQPGKAEPQILSLTVLKLDETRLMGVLSDITLQVKREQQLKQNEAWFNAILTGISDYALVHLNRNGDVEGWNASIGRLTGFSQTDVLERPYSLFYPENAVTSERLLDRLLDADTNGWSLDEGYCLKNDGSRFWASTMLTPLHIPRETGLAAIAGVDVLVEPSYCLVIRDISDKREASEAHRLSTACDFLTGIANRRAFYEAAALELERMKRSPREMSLILFDADLFKTINDRFGHPAGDAVLRHFAATLTATFRQVDVVARVGGEEFAVLLPSTGLETACQVGERLRVRVAAEPVDIGGQSIFYTVSGGITCVGPGITGLDELMKRADQALYRAKASGRNRLEIWTPG